MIFLLLLAAGAFAAQIKTPVNPIVDATAGISKPIEVTPEGLTLPAPALDGPGATALVSAGLEGSPARPEAVEPIWTALENWVSERPPAGTLSQAAAWRREAAERLRNFPGTPLNQAMAESFVRLRGLDPKAAPSIERLLSADYKRAPFPQPYRDKNPQSIGIEHMTAHRGRIFAKTNEGLFIYERGRWREDRSKALRGLFITFIEKLDGALFLGALSPGWNGTGGLFARRGGRWELVFREPYCKAVLSAAKIDGTLYIGTGSGLFRKNDAAHSGWDHILEDSIYSQIHFIGKMNDRIYAATRHLVYEQKIPGSSSWITHDNLRYNAEYIFDAASIDGRFYLGTDEGLYSDFKPVIEGPTVFQVAKIKGALTAATDAGIYRYANDRWERLRGERDTRRLVSWGGGVLVNGVMDVYKLVSLPPDIPKGWPAAVLDSLKREIGRLQPAPNPAPVAEPAVSGDDPRIVDQKGRTIFSTLARWLGESGRDFPSASGDGWRTLETLLLKALGVLAPSRAERWRENLVSRLRDNPASDLPAAAAETFGQAHELGADALALVKGHLSGRGQFVPGMDQYLYRLLPVGDELYVSADEGLYKKVGKEWRKTDLASWVSQMEKHAGEVYAAAPSGVSVYNASDEAIRMGTGAIAHFLDGFHQFSFVDGFLYAVGERGLFAREGVQWRKLWGRFGKDQVHHVAAHEGKIHIATERGVFAQDAAAVQARLAADRSRGRAARAFWSLAHWLGWWPGWRRVKATHGNLCAVYQVAWKNGRRYAATEMGLFVDNDFVHALGLMGVYQIETGGDRVHVLTGKGVYAENGKTWTKLALPDAKVKRLARAGGTLYAATNKGLLALPALIDGWEDPLLPDIARALEASEERKKHSEPVEGIPEAREGAISDRKGRTIFDVGPKSYAE